MREARTWIQGKQYDVADPNDRIKILDVIEDNRDRGAIGDQTSLAFALMTGIQKIHTNQMQDEVEAMADAEGGE